MYEEIISTNGLKKMLHCFHDNEHVQFMAFIVADLPVKVESLDILKVFVDNLKTLTVKEDIIFKKKSFKDLTEDLAEFDKMRDAIFRSCRNMLKDLAQIGTEAEKEAIHRLQPVFDTYKNINKANYEGESSEVSNFVRDISKLQLANYVQVLGINNRIDALADVNDKFIETFKQRAYLQENQNNLGIMSEVRKDLNDLFISLVHATNALYTANALGQKNEATASKLRNVADTLNTFIDRFILMLSRRGIHISRKKGGGGEGGDDDGTESNPPSGGGGGGLGE